MNRVLALLLATFLILFTPNVCAQVTTTVFINGATIVQIIGTNAQGVPFTQPIATLNPAAPVPGAPATGAPVVPDPNNPAPVATTPAPAPISTPTPSPSPSSTTAIVANTDTAMQGPVGAPAATTGTPGAPIPYAYTTVVGGVTTVIQDIFTPTSPQTVSVTPTVTGSILDYSDWLTLVGANPSTGLVDSGFALRPSMFVVPSMVILCWIGTVL